jgi:hypothetical protein
LATFGNSIYSIKPDSAGGRLLIWKISLHMIAKNPLVGIGFDKYKVDYENYQSDYFGSGAGTLYEEKVADHVIYAYNEPLQICIELGIIGFILFLSIFGIAFFSLSKQGNIKNPLLLSALAAVVSFFVDSCFSYPLSIMPSYINLLFLLSIISASTSSQHDIIFHIPIYVQKIFAICLFALATFIGRHSYTLSTGYRGWQKAFQSTMRNEAINARYDYQKLYPILKENGKFLFMYGDVLQRLKKHDEAILVMEAAKKNYNDPNLWLTLGISYEALGNYEKAEEHYYKAANIVPHLLYPKYLLIQLFMKTGKTEKAIALGRKFLILEEKVPSKDTQKMKDDIKILVETKQFPKDK